MRIVLSKAALASSAALFLTITEADAQTAPSGTPPAATSDLATSSQDTSSNPANLDIVVTAQRREQRLQDVPVSVSVVGGETLVKQNLRSLADIATQTPALKIAHQSNSDILTIRGVGSGSNGGFEQSVGTFVDGIYRGRSRSSFAALFDIERVEVLKGPQTTFFGNNTIAGALNISTRKPSQNFGIEASALGTPSIGEYSFEAAVTGPLTPTLSARIAGKAYGMDGYIYNAALNEDEPRLRQLIGRVSLRWEPSAGFRSDLRIDRVHTRDKGTLSPELLDCPPPAPFTVAGICALYLAQEAGHTDTIADYRSFTGRSFINYDMTEVAWTNAIPIADDTLTSTTGFFHHNSEYVSSASPLYVPGVGGTSTRIPYLNPERYTSYSQELRLESPSNRLLQYVVGAYYLHGNLHNDDYTGNYAPTAAQLARYSPIYFPATTPIAGHRGLYQKEETLSAFAALTVRPVSSLRLNVSGRFTHVSKSAHHFIVYGVGGDIPGPGSFAEAPALAQPSLALAFAGSNAEFTDPNRTFKKFMPSASVQYDLASNATAYASYTKGFKAGGFADGNTPVTFDSETADAYEVGLKGSLSHGQLIFGADLFLTNFDNLQEAVTVIAVPIINTITNAAKSRARGVEANVAWRPIPNILAKVDATYADSKYLQYQNAACTVLQATMKSPCTQDLSGRVRAYAPKLSGNFSIDVRIPVSTQYSAHVNPNVYYTSGYFQNASLDALTFQPRYAKIDLRIGFGPDDGRWEVAMLAKNLSNKYTFGQSAALSSSPGSHYVVPDQPRTFSITASVRY